MVRVAPIKLQVGPKVLWFDPTDLDIRAGDDVIVNTSRGLEYGIATSDVLEVSDDLVKDLKSPLKEVVRLATPEDMDKVRELEEKSAPSARCVQGDRAPSPTRICIRCSSSIFSRAIRQSSISRQKSASTFASSCANSLPISMCVSTCVRSVWRDGARIIGGLGHCGQELCCTRFGGEFSPVSIRMAKEQNLSLNPQKISGVCGRLMCCLRYEYDTYKEFNSRAPKMGAKIETPDGIAKVTDINVPSERITITLEDGSNLKIPLEDFEAPEEGRRPHVISAEVYEEYVQKSQFDALGGAGLVDVINFSGDDIPVGARPAARLDGEGSSSSAEAEGKRRKRRRNRGNKEGENRNSSQKNNQGKKQSGDRGGEGARSGKKESSGRNRRNRGGASNGQNKRSNNAQGNRQNNGNRKNGGAQGARPGQKSSGLSSLHENPNTKRDSKSSGASTHRRSRRRSHTTGGENNAGGQS